MEEAKKDRKKARKDRKDRKRQQKKVRRPRPQKQQQPDLLTYLLMSKMTGGGGSGGGGISVGPQPLTSQLGQLQAEIAKKTSDLESRLANLASDNAILLEGIKQAETRFGTQQGLAQEQTKQLIQEVKEDIGQMAMQQLALPATMEQKLLKQFAEPMKGVKVSVGGEEKTPNQLEDDIRGYIATFIENPDKYPKLNTYIGSLFGNREIVLDNLAGAVLKKTPKDTKDISQDEVQILLQKINKADLGLPRGRPKKQQPIELPGEVVMEKLEYGDPSNQEEGGSMGTAIEEVFGGV